EGARGRSSVLPGHRRRRARRHPGVRAPRRDPLRLRSRHSGPEGVPGRDGSLRRRSASQDEEDSRVISNDEAIRLIEGPAEALPELLARATEARARKPVTFSKKVFVPLTTLCRDYC